MANRLDQIIDAFSTADDELRLELLLDYSRKLPPLPLRFQPERDAGLHRVPECMSPVFMWVEREDDAVHIYVDVAEEAPTVKGFLAILLQAYDGASPRELADAPPDLINRLGLSDLIRMNRAIGLTAILGRVRRHGRELAERDAST